MRIAKWARKSQHTITYRPKYGLGKKIASLTSKDVDKMYVILPFEKTFYEDKHNFPVEFVGHPLIDAIHNNSRFHQI
jgi:lipid-A-disaccharide synthase